MSFDLEAALAKHEAIVRGHFELSSGKHSSVYFQLAKLLAVPSDAADAARALADHFRPHGIESVVAPAIGGIVLSFVVAQALNVPSYFTERVGKGFALRRGFKLREGEKVLVVEDVLTTGGSALEVVDLVRRHGALAVGIGAMVNRGNFSAEGIDCHALLNLSAPLYEPGKCPLCLDGKPLEKPGSSPKKRKPKSEPAAVPNP